MACFSNSSTCLSKQGPFLQCMKTRIVHIHIKGGCSRAHWRGWSHNFLFRIFRRICHAPPAIGMMQAVSGKTVIAPRYRCPKVGAYRRASPKSVGEREQVSLSPALSSRPVCHAGSRAAVVARIACPHHLRKQSSWRRTPCRYHAGFVPASSYIQFSKISRKEKCPSTYRGFRGGFTPCFYSGKKEIFLLFSGR